MWHTWAIRETRTGFGGRGDLKESAWKLRCRCEKNIKMNLKYNETKWTAFI
jgi:hypothetical protein